MPLGDGAQTRRGSGSAGGAGGAGGGGGEGLLATAIGTRRLYSVLFD